MALNANRHADPNNDEITGRNTKAYADIQRTIWLTRKLIRQSRECMSEVDRLLAHARWIPPRH